MTTYYDTLGVAKDASDADIKKAYKKLASKHHPDKGGDTAKFQEIQAAYDVVGDAEKRKQYDAQGPDFQQFRRPQPNMSDMDEILRAFQAAQQHQQRNAIPFIRLRVTLADAFKGCTVKLNVNGTEVPYKVRAGLPPGVAYQDEIKVGTEKKVVQFQINVITDEFHFVQIGSEDGMTFYGHLQKNVEVNAIDMLAGGFIFVEDFLGVRMQVRVPSGFDPKTRLKVAGKGYTNWIGDKAGPRGDLYLTVTPKFQSVTELDPKKVEELYNATRSTSKDSSGTAKT